LTHTLVAELYSSVPVRMGALQDVFYSRKRMPCVASSSPGRHGDVNEEAVRRIATTTHGYLQL